MAEYRRYSVHESLGGGSVADVLLWKKWGSSAALLVCSTTLWFLFEHAGYNLLTFIANVLLLLITILFLWAKSALLLNRPLPPIPDLEVSDESVVKAADVIRVWVNNLLNIAHQITIGKNLKLCGQVAVTLWFVSCIGSFFSFLTLLYIGVIISLSAPLLYEKYRDQIDRKLIVAHSVVETEYKKLEQVFRMIPLINKEKKTQ